MAYANKKSDLSLRTLVEIIIFVALFFFAYKIATGFLDFFAAKHVEGTKKSFDGLVLEMNNLDKKIGVPVYLDENTIIEGVRDGAYLPKCNEEKSCLCICYEDRGCNAVENGIIKCSEIDFTLEKDFHIKAKIAEGKPKVQNCILEKINEEISVSQCIS